MEFNEQWVRVVDEPSAACDDFFDNGKQRKVFSYVKNSSWKLTIELNEAGLKQNIDLRQFSWDASLVYNLETKKAVGYIKKPPLASKANVSNCGKKVTFECKINVLTSQHEDIFFLIKFQGVSQVADKPHPNLLCYSEPIKIVSKPEQPKNKRKSSIDEPKAVKKRKTKAEKLVDSLNKIKEQQEYQEQLIRQLQSKISLQNNNNNPMMQFGFSVSNNIPNRIQENIQNLSSKKDKQDFLPAFSKLLHMFNKIPIEERGAKLQSAIRRLPTTSTVIEFYDLLLGEGLPSNNSINSNNNNNINASNSITWNLPDMPTDLFGAPLASTTVTISPGFDFEFLDFVETSNGCTCSVCPFKSELDKIEQFTKEIFPSNYEGF